MFTATVDFSGYRVARDLTIRTLEFGVRDAAREGAEEGAAEAKRSGRFQNRTGRLRAGIVARFVNSSQNSATWEILSAEHYSRYLEEGTRPHEIWPKAAHGSQGPLRNGQTRRATGKGPHEHIVGRGIALRWVSGGTTHFAGHVFHPGTSPDPFIGPGYLKAERVMYATIESCFAKAEQYWK